MDENAMLKAIEQMFQSERELTRQMIQAETKPIVARLDTLQDENKTIVARLDTLQKDVNAMQEDIDIIKEEAAITRHTANLVLKWAEKADRTTVNVGLYDDEMAK